MALTEDERMLVEAFQTMLTTGDGLGLAKHKEELKDLGLRERGFEYLHGQIDEMMHLKTASMTHHTGVCAAFAKIHSYKYLDDPHFEAAMEKEMSAQGIPTEERQEALDLIPQIIQELKQETGRDERDGFHPDLDEILEQNSDDGVGTS